MNAREMFEELGYRCYKTGASILYINYSDDKGDRMIEFYYSNFTFDAVDKNCGPLRVNVKELEAINKQCKELGWLEDEKQEIKQETNIEHYYEYLSEVGLGSFALVNGRCKECSGTRCSECDFSGDCSDNCNKKRLRWLASTYIKRYKLTQFEYDLIQTYSDYGDYKLSKFYRLKKLKDKGYFKDVDKEETINEILSNFEVKDRNEGKND